MLYTLQSLRFVFILLIILSHLIGRKFDFGGECGVAFFFMLSGFVLSLAYGQQVEDGEFSRSRLMKKQLLKFYPLHLLLFCIFLFLDARIGHTTEWYQALASILLIQSWIPFNDFYFAANSVSWFLCDILFFYVLFQPLCHIIHHVSWQRLTVGLLVGLSLYTILAVCISDNFVGAILYVSPLTRLADFMLGIVVHRFYASHFTDIFICWLNKQPRHIITVFEVTMVLAVATLAWLYPIIPWHIRQAAIYWPFMAAIIWFFAATDLRKGMIGQFLNQRFFLFLASISMELFLTHLLVIRIIYSLLDHLGVISADAPTVAAMLLCLTIMVPVALLMKKYFVDKIYGIGVSYVK